MQPIKRADALVTLSHDHHHGLMLCWKIRKGLANNIAIERINQYCRWFYREHLIPHFNIEEEVAFPVLGDHHEHIIEAVKQHRVLSALFEHQSPTREILLEIEKQLNDHIRFEERVVFNEIQEQATEQQLATIKAAHATEAFAENIQDAFWK